MSTTCGKDGSERDFQSSQKTAQEYQAKQEKQADKTIEQCVEGKITEQQAKQELAKQFKSDPKGFQKAIEKLEEKLGNRSTVQSVRSHINKDGGRSISVQYKEGYQENFNFTWQFGGPPANMTPGQEMMRTGYQIKDYTTNTTREVIVEYQRIVDPETGKERIATMKTIQSDDEGNLPRGRDVPHATKHEDGVWHDRYSQDEEH